MCPVNVRAPSGNTTNDTPSFKEASAWRIVLTIHEPIAPKGQGAENIKATMTEAYAAVESSLPEKFKGMVKNEDQDR